MALIANARRSARIQTRCYVGVANVDAPGRVLCAALLWRAFDVPVVIERTPRGALVVQPVAMDSAVNGVD